MAIGADALKSVKRIREIPVIYLMVLNPEKITGNAKNFAGVDMIIPPEKYLSLMENLHLTNMRVGILYDPEQSGDLVKKIQQTARAKGIEITAREVRKAKDVPVAISGMKGSFNLFWMLPDSTVVTPETFEFLLLFTQQKRTPVVTFAGKYVDTGALASLDIYGMDLGKQAGEMANRVLDCARVSDIPRAEARKAVMKINRKIAVKLGINLAGIENY